MYIGRSKSSKPYPERVGEKRQFFTLFQYHRPFDLNALIPSMIKYCNPITKEADILVTPKILHSTYDPHHCFQNGNHAGGI